MLEPLLPKSNNRCGRWQNHHQVINGIIHQLITSCHWHQLPTRFGPWQTIHKHHSRWPADGSRKRLLQHAQAITAKAVPSTGTPTSTPHQSRPTSTPPAHRPIHHHYLRLPQKGCCKNQFTYTHTRTCSQHRQRGRQNPRPFPGRPDHEDPPQRGRQTPPTLPGPHARTTR
ncbi:MULTISPECIES: transposase [Streptomyces]|uniref:transposase n=1 Tax=Streptomyces TaxID=1883 RepID=UPI0035582BBA